MSMLVVAVMALVAVLAVAEAASVLLEAMTVGRNGVRTTGRLVDVREAPARRRRRRYLPVIELVTQEGQRVVASPRTGRTIGERVPHPPRTVDVVYDRVDPSRVVTPVNGSTGVGMLWPVASAVVTIVALLWAASRAGLVRGLPVPTGIPTGWLVAALLGVVFLAVGVRSVLAARSAAEDERRILAAGTRVPGVITGVHLIDMGQGEHLRVPVIAYRTLDGAELSSWPTGGVSNRTFTPGRPVTVAYDPQDPRTIYTDANGSLGGTSWIGYLVGAVFVVVGVVALALTITVWALGVG